MWRVVIESRDGTRSEIAFEGSPDTFAITDCLFFMWYGISGRVPWIK